MNRITTIALSIFISLTSSHGFADTERLAKSMTNVIDKNHASKFDSSFMKQDLEFNLRKARAGFVTVDILVNGSTDHIRAKLEDMGLSHITVSDYMLSGSLPESRLSEVANLPQVKHIRPYGGFTRNGSVRSQGYWAMKANTARDQLGYYGSGVKIGVMSDSFDCLHGADNDIGTGDLPNNITVVQEIAHCEFGTDEGRALIQVMYDIAPQASYYFHTGFNGGSAGNAEAIRRLHEEFSVNIIVDDFASYYEPMFQDDLTTQAINDVVRQGVVYVTAAGNAGNNSYEQVFRPVYAPGLDITAHDFDPGPSNDTGQLLTIPPGKSLTLVLQWDQPHYSVSGGEGNQVDLDVFLIDAQNNEIVASASSNNLGNDPVEVLQFANPDSAFNDRFKLIIAHVNGDMPTLIKYVLPIKFEGSIDEYATNSSTIIGHSNAAGAITVGATHYKKTTTFDHPHNEVDDYSSTGGTPIIYSTTGQRATDYAVVRRKPDVTAPNGVNTTFYPGEDIEGDSKPNFYGTSAAAPHVAAMAALILEARPALSPAHVKHLIQKTAKDITRMEATTLPNGFDYKSGYGLIHTTEAVKRAKKLNLNNPLASQQLLDSYPLPVFESTTDIKLPQVSGGGSLTAYVIFALLVLLLYRARRRHTQR